MALINCPECGKQVSNKARSCPGCGFVFRSIYPTGFEWKSKANIRGIPFVHVCFGFMRPGVPRVAKGIIAIGQFAVGLICIAQFGVGFLFGLGQFMISVISIGQFSAGALIGIGQFTCGILAIGQVAVGHYAICQWGFATYMWSPARVDMEAVALFHTIYTKLTGLFGIRA